MNPLTEVELKELRQFADGLEQRKELPRACLPGGTARPLDGREAERDTNYIVSIIRRSCDQLEHYRKSDRPK